MLKNGKEGNHRHFGWPKISVLENDNIVAELSLKHLIILRLILRRLMFVKTTRGLVLGRWFYYMTYVI